MKGSFLFVTYGNRTRPPVAVTILLLPSLIWVIYNLQSLILCLNGQFALSGKEWALGTFIVMPALAGWYKNNIN